MAGRGSSLRTLAVSSSPAPSDRHTDVAAKTEVVNEGVVAFTSGSLPRRWFVRTVLRRKLFGPKFYRPSSVDIAKPDGVVALVWSFERR